MSSFPCSIFSESELNVTRWFSEKCGLPALPTVRQIKAHRKDVLSKAGANATTVKGAMGNLFSILDFTSIVAHVRLFHVLVCISSDEPIFRNGQTLWYTRMSVYSVKIQAKDYLHHAR